MLHLCGGFCEAKLSRGWTFLSVIRSGRFTPGDGSESSPKGTAHFRLANHVTALAGTYQQCLTQCIKIIHYIVTSSRVINGFCDGKSSRKIRLERTKRGTARSIVVSESHCDRLNEELRFVIFGKRQKSLKKRRFCFPAAAQSHSQHKTPAERRLRRRGAERTTSQHKDGLNDYANEDVFARGREWEQRARI